MNEKEEKLAMKILEGAPLEDSDRELLEQSTECREYKEVLDHAMALRSKPVEPAPPLDRAILKYASKTISSSDESSKTPLQFKLVLTLAASIAFLLVAFVIVSQKETKPAGDGARIVKSDIEVQELPRVHNTPPKMLPYRPTYNGKKEPAQQSKQQVAATPQKPKTQTIETHDWNFAELDEELTVIETELYLDETLTTGAELVENTVL